MCGATCSPPGSYDQAMERAHYFIHTASPYVLDVDDPQTDLVDPAVQGTRNVLEAARRGGVHRVVLTSSMAAITDEPGGDEVLTEDDWNEKSSLSRNPYCSKTMAERKARAGAGTRAWAGAGAGEEVKIASTPIARCP